MWQFVTTPSINEDASSIQGLVGASSSDNYDKIHWRNITEIIKFTKKYMKNISCNVDLPIIPWTGKKGHDCLCFLNFDSHCFVLLYLYKAKFAYIADGTNRFIEDPKKSEDIREIVGLPLKALSYNQQFKIDFCASSAVLIALELLTNYKKNIFPRELIPSPSLVKRVRGEMGHMSGSTPLDIPLHLRKKNLSCPYCGKSFRGKNSSYKPHIRKCSSM